ncbi:heme-binding protein [Fictibacillus terranigra]|uniref:Heme-binding protein n=1 Tax=Fictibacillus terranigra TaxID=3058424 RepID=A0ABT8E1F0_9BACL|nr:heme-binding protein [Fictibacillus sp. CENA-BCM004]MDN4071747.1 heme-binding protein [Fictibacillus sp. CENA-BCM004]
MEKIKREEETLQLPLALQSGLLIIFMAQQEGKKVAADITFNGVNGEHRFAQSRFAAYGEVCPIKIQGVGVAGIITVSGLTPEEDHVYFRNPLLFTINNIENAGNRRKSGS